MTTAGAQRRRGVTSEASGRLDRDFLGLGGFRLRHRHLEDPILVGGGDLRPVRVLREREAARERSVDALPTECIGLVDLGLLLALTLDRQNAVLDMDVEVLAIDAGNFGLEDELIALLEDVHGGRPRAGVDLKEVLERIPPYELHFLSLLSPFVLFPATPSGLRRRPLG